MNDEKKYMQVKMPDVMALAEMVIKAKGRMRTMAQLSEACGVNTSTLSRIANGKISRPLTIEVLQSIYDNRDTDADFSFERLLRANGMISEDNVERRKTLEDRLLELDDKKRHGENCKRQAKNVIINALLARGILVRKIPASFERHRTEAPYGISLPYDFTVYIEDAMPQLWYFKVIDTMDTLEGINRAFRILSAFFLLDSWEPGFFDNTKTTFVFNDEVVFGSVVQQYRDAPIKTTMSAILIDIKTEKIIDEKPISGKVGIPSVLSRPETEEEGLIASWELYEDYDEYESLD